MLIILPSYKRDPPVHKNSRLSFGYKADALVEFAQEICRRIIQRTEKFRVKSAKSRFF